MNLTDSENYSLKTQFREKFINTELSIMSTLDYLLSWLQIFNISPKLQVKIGDI